MSAADLAGRLVLPDWFLAVAPRQMRLLAALLDPRTGRPLPAGVPLTAALIAVYGHAYRDNERRAAQAKALAEVRRRLQQAMDQAGLFWVIDWDRERLALVPTHEIVRGAAR